MLIQAASSLKLQLEPWQFADALYLSGISATTDGSKVEPVHNAESAKNATEIKGDKKSVAQKSSREDPVTTEGKHAKESKGKQKRGTTTELFTGGRSSDDLGTNQVPASKILVPGGGISFKGLELSRAFRSLRKRIPSRAKYQFDEEATVDFVASTGKTIPIFRKTLENSFNLQLFEDHSSSMILWREPLNEFYKLVRHLGSFHKVEILSLDRLLVHNYEGRDRLNQTNIALILSDCVEEHWFDAKMLAKLSKVCETQPLAILNLLPAKLKTLSATGIPTERLLSSAQGAATSKYKLLKEDLCNNEDSSAGADFAVPVLSLEPRSFREWVAVVMAKSGASCAASIIDLREPEESLVDREQQFVESLRDRLESFKWIASPIAMRLATYLSIVPLTLPVMRLVQKIMLPESSNQHLAEFFLGGLIERITPIDARCAINDIEFDFLRNEKSDESIRDLLSANLSKVDFIRVTQALTEHCQTNFGKTIDFTALVRAKDGAQLIPESARRFAEISVELLERSGVLAVLSEHDAIQGPNLDEHGLDRLSRQIVFLNLARSKKSDEFITWFRTQSEFFQLDVEISSLNSISDLRRYEPGALVVWCVASISMYEELSAEARAIIDPQIVVAEWINKPCEVTALEFGNLESWNEVVDAIIAEFKSPGQTLGYAHWLPAFPELYVRRINSFERLKNLLLSSQGNEKAIQVDSLPLLNDMVRDYEVRKHFAGGIYWVDAAHVEESHSIATAGNDKLFVIVNCEIPKNIYESSSIKVIYSNSSRSSLADQFTVDDFNLDEAFRYSTMAFPEQHIDYAIFDSCVSELYLLGSPFLLLVAGFLSRSQFNFRRSSLEPGSLLRHKFRIPGLSREFIKTAIEKNAEVIESIIDFVGSAKDKQALRKSPKILIIGSVVDDLPPKTRLISRALGRILAEANCRILTFGKEGVDKVLVGSFWDHLNDDLKDAERLTVCSDYQGNNPLGFGQTIQSENVEKLVHKVDAVILVGGGKNVEKIFERAQELEKVVVPIPGVSSNTTRLFHDMISRSPELSKLDFSVDSIQNADALALEVVQYIWNKLKLDRLAIPEKDGIFTSISEYFDEYDWRVYDYEGFKRIVLISNIALSESSLSRILTSPRVIYRMVAYVWLCHHPFLSVLDELFGCVKLESIRSDADGKVSALRLGLESIYKTLTSIVFLDSNAVLHMQSIEFCSKQLSESIVDYNECKDLAFKIEQVLKAHGIAHEFAEETTYGKFDWSSDFNRLNELLEELRALQYTSTNISPMDLVQSSDSGLRLLGYCQILESTSAPFLEEVVASRLREEDNLFLVFLIVKVISKLQARSRASRISGLAFDAIDLLERLSCLDNIDVDNELNGLFTHMQMRARFEAFIFSSLSEFQKYLVDNGQSNILDGEQSSSEQSNSSYGVRINDLMVDHSLPELRSNLDFKWFITVFRRSPEEVLTAILGDIRILLRNLLFIKRVEQTDGSTIGGPTLGQLTTLIEESDILPSQSVEQVRRLHFLTKVALYSPNSLSYDVCEALVNYVICLGRAIAEYFISDDYEFEE